MYEVEIKVELTSKEKERLVQYFKEKGFQSKGVTPQNDFYIEAKQSPYGGFDLRRYRQEGDRFIYTEKVWEMVGDTRARKENEHEVTKVLMETEIAKFPHAIKIKKDREWFEGSYQSSKISLTIDSVKFDHSLSQRYFVEAEIVVKDKLQVKETKAKIFEFLKEILGKPSGLIESPGMFTMAMEKK